MHALVSASPSPAPAAGSFHSSRPATRNTAAQVWWSTWAMPARLSSPCPLPAHKQVLTEPHSQQFTVCPHTHTSLIEPPCGMEYRSSHVLQYSRDGREGMRFMYRLHLKRGHRQEQAGASVSGLCWQFSLELPSIVLVCCTTSVHDCRISTTQSRPFSLARPVMKNSSVILLNKAPS